MDPEAGQRRTALVTGASSGIGLELARLLAADGVNLILVARNAVRLQQLAEQLQSERKISARCYPTDLSEPQAAPRLWRDVASAGLVVDILVNNAGAGLYGRVAQQDPDALERMLQVNIGALTSLTRLALPGMQLRRWGSILNVGSIVAYQPAGPNMAAYYASKAFVLSFSKGLARELVGSGVSVTVLSPALTESAFEERSGAAGTRLYRLLPKMTAAEVARAGYEGMKRRSAVVLPGWTAKLLAFAGELPPRRIALEVNRLLLQKGDASARTTSF
jgi:short-subunit dehydrogenase